MTITLLNGQQVDSADVQLNTSNLANAVSPVWTYAPTGATLDGLLKLSDMISFPGFDKAEWNNFLYTLNYQSTHSGANPPPVGSTSTWTNFWNQIETNPLAAPLDSLNTAVRQVLSSSGVQDLIFWALAGTAIFILLKASK